VLTYKLQVKKVNKKTYEAKGFILEDGIQIARFKRGPITDGFIQEMKFEFFTERSETRWLGFCDSLSSTETVDAMLGL
jgi:hypothetical protein